MRRFAAAWLALAGTMLTACVTDVRLLPRAAGWAVAGDEATWRAGGVEVSAALAVTDFDLPARGSVRCPAGAQVAFVPDQPMADGGALGELHTPNADAPAVAIADGAWYAAVAGRSGTAAVEFALRPDERWNGTPKSGARITYAVVVRVGDAETRCPFEFRAQIGPTRVTTLGAIGIGAGVAVLLAAIFVGATAYFVATSFS